MSRLLLKALGGTVAITLLTAPLGLPGTAPAHALEPDTRPATIVVRAVATGPDQFNSSATVAVPPGGNAQVLSPTLDGKTTKVHVSYDAPVSDSPGFEEMALTLIQQPSSGKRVMVCLQQAALRTIREEMIAELSDTFEQYEAVAQARFVLYVQTCLRLAVMISEILAESASARTAATLASTPCGRATIGIRTKVTKSGGQFRLTTKGKPRSKPKAAKVKVTCKALGENKARLTIKSKKKGQPLRKALGPHVAIAMASPSSAEQGATVKVGFTAP